MQIFRTYLSIRDNIDSRKTLTKTNGTSTQSRRLVILLAEEDVVIRNLVTLALQRAKFDVLVAADGQEALDLSRRFKDGIDLLITDIEMPRMDGNDLGEVLLQERPGIRVLQMSGWNAQDIAGRNLSLAFLQKPFTPASLIDCIRSVMSAPPGKRELLDCEKLLENLRP